MARSIKREISSSGKLTTSHQKLVRQRKLRLAAVAMAVSTLPQLAHADQTWAGTNTTAWNTNTNWSNLTLPSGTQAIINTNTGNIATITVDGAFIPTNIIVGSLTATNGRV